MKTTLKDIRKMVEWGHFIDLNEIDEEWFENVRKSYNELIAYSIGTYGVSGKVFLSSYDNRLYAFTKRTTRSFMI